MKETEPLPQKDQAGQFPFTLSQPRVFIPISTKATIGLDYGLSHWELALFSWPLDIFE